MISDGEDVSAESLTLHDLEFDLVKPDEPTKFTYSAGVSLMGGATWGLLTGDNVRFNTSWVLSEDETFDADTDALWGMGTVPSDQRGKLQVHSSKNACLRNHHHQ